VSPRRGTAGAGALLGIALALAGCGLGPGKGLGDVRLTVTRDYGTEPVLDRAVGGINESDTVMRVLERSAAISTRYGGGFVQSIDGVEAKEGSAGSYDWFFYVNGVQSPVGAAAYPLHGGEAIWWDYRDWSATMQVPAVVGSWPQPLSSGYEGKRRPVVLECRGAGGACREVRSALRSAGVSVAKGMPSGAIRVLVGPWPQLQGDSAAEQIDEGPQVSGVFAEFVPRGGGFELQGLSEDGKPARSFGASAGLIAATRRFEAPPTWVISGASVTGVRAAAASLNSTDLRDHYAVATEAGKETALPLR